MFVNVKFKNFDGDKRTQALNKEKHFDDFELFFQNPIYSGIWAPRFTGVEGKKEPI